MSDPGEREFRAKVDVTVTVDLNFYLEQGEDDEDARELAHDLARDEIPFGLIIQDTELVSIEEVSVA